jgi:hypothetical protein
MATRTSGIYMDYMDEQDPDLDFEDLGGDTETEADTEIFYWALKIALERKSVEPAPASSS